jgi:hypothetical protein
MLSKKVTVAQNDVISTHCHMFSLYQVPVQLPAAAPPPLLQRCNHHSHHCGIDSLSLLLSTTSVAVTSPALLLLLRCAIVCQSRRRCNSRPPATSSCMASELPSCVLSCNNAATDMPRLHEVTQYVCALCANAVVHYGLSLGGIRSTS